MTRKYNAETTPAGQEIVWFEENGIRYSMPCDPNNSDYQQYLESLKDAEKL